MKSFLNLILLLPRTLFIFLEKLFAGPWDAFKKFTLKWKIIVITAGFILLIIFSQSLGNLFQKPPYTTTQVERSDITEVVSETGVIEAEGKVSVYSPTDGFVIDVFIKNGQNVSEGQELFSVESSATVQEQQNAYSNYLTAQSNLNSAQSNLNVLRASMYDVWDSFRDLATGDEFETGDNQPKEKERIESPDFQIAQDNWLAAEKKYKDQQTVVAQAKAQVASTWLLYQATQNSTVLAPTDGIVANLAIATGKSVSVKSLTTVTQPALSIVKSANTEVVVSLTESDISKVREGQTASIEIDAIDKTLDGVVSRVDSVGTNSLGVIRYNVFINVLDPEEKLRSGMTADVIITTNKIKNVLSVPNSAIKPYKGGKAVRIPDGKEFKFLPVQTGVRGESRTQVLKGLSEGQEIIVSLSNEQIKRPGLFGT